MKSDPYIAESAALIGDPARASMLSVLMDGRARTATELAQTAGVTAQTASGHLAKLREGNLVVVDRQGRHRYYRLASEKVAQALEALMVLSRDGPPRHRPPGPRDAQMRFARTCYDHLAGQLGVAVTDRFLSRGYLIESGQDFELTKKGELAFTDFGLDLNDLRHRKRLFARRCLDWSERRGHLGGALGAAFLARCQQIGWIKRQSDTRAVRLTRAGIDGLANVFSINATMFGE
ncbi:MAG: ArsR/SmtB family transcription factor [Methyloligellaceae bacterium]